MESGYHTWPLFNEFRETEQFVSAYSEVFGHPYTSKLRETADQASKQAAEEAQKGPSEVTQTVEVADAVSTNIENIQAESGVGEAGLAKAEPE